MLLLNRFSAVLMTTFRSVGFPPVAPKEAQMAKSARKRRARRKKNANHGKRPNA